MTSGSKLQPRIPWPSRFLLRFNIVLAAGLWAECSILAVRDWTLILAPLIFTAIVAFQWWALRKVYCAQPIQPPPVAACLHRGAVPVESVLGDVIAKLCPDCDEQLDADFTPRPAGA